MTRYEPAIDPAAITTQTLIPPRRWLRDAEAGELFKPQVLQGILKDNAARMLKL